MALGLDQRCIKRLREALSDDLRKIKIDNDTFVNYLSTASLYRTSDILPASGNISKKINEYIGEIPLPEFVIHSITRDLQDRYKFDGNKKEVSLSSYSGYEDLRACADRMVADFESLPWNYTFSIELDNLFSRHIKKEQIEFSLTPNIRIITPGQSYDTDFPLKSDIELRNTDLFGGFGFLTIHRERNWNKEAAYIQIESQGFIGVYGVTPPIEDVIACLKSFLGLSMAVRLIKINKIPRFIGLTMYSNVPNIYLIIHRKNNVSEILRTHRLPDEISEAISQLDIDDMDGKVTSELYGSWILSKLQRVSLVFNNLKKAERLFLAGQWLFDSYIGKNNLLSFVQTMVAMEILLGESSKSDIIGIGELLRNRCAYLIGSSYDEREAIINDFNKIYDIRSKIIHRGKSKLNADELILFDKLRWMCRRVIAEEIDLLKEEKGKTK